MFKVHCIQLGQDTESSKLELCHFNRIHKNNVIIVNYGFNQDYVRSWQGAWICIILFDPHSNFLGAIYIYFCVEIKVLRWNNLSWVVQLVSARAWIFALIFPTQVLSVSTAWCCSVGVRTYLLRPPVSLLTCIGAHSPITFSTFCYRECKYMISLNLN